MKVRISRRASTDLEEIADWIALDSPVQADRFVNELLERGFSLADIPDVFRVSGR